MEVANSDIQSISSAFRDLVLKYKNWNEVKDLSEEEMKVFKDILSAAGFEVKEVTWGKITSNYRDQDGSATGETYNINHISPFKVLDENGKDYYRPTGWLDCAFRLVLDGVYQGKSRDEIGETLKGKIIDSIPLPMIQITRDGDKLKESSPDGYFEKHTRDDDEIKNCHSVHAFCDGYIDICGATEAQNALVCRHCHLRVLFPKEIKTYGELRKYFVF